jgi:predicted N-acyltransferase
MPTLRVHESPAALSPDAWNRLLAASPQPTPFMRHEYLQALHDSGSAMAETGWQPQFLSLWRGDELLAACPAYLKGHSYGEYVQLCKVAPLDQVSERPDHERSEASRGRHANGHSSWATAA